MSSCEGSHRSATWISRHSQYELTIPRLHSKNALRRCWHSSGRSWDLRQSWGVRGGSDRRTQSVLRRHATRDSRMSLQDTGGRMGVSWLVPGFGRDLLGGKVAAGGREATAAN